MYFFCGLMEPFFLQAFSEWLGEAGREERKGEWRRGEPDKLRMFKF